MVADVVDRMKPEERVRQTVIAELKKKGWKDEQLQWKPEWEVPDTPHDLSKREQGRKFASCGRCDLVLFEDDSKEWHALAAVFEFKQPKIDAGKSQLLRYLSNEPQAKMGFWTNGTASLAIYKTPDGKWKEDRNPKLPGPDDDLTKPPSAPLTWDTMDIPSETLLTGAFKRLLNTVVSTDTRSVRREAQLNEIVNVLLVKLDSDSMAAAEPDSSVAFRVLGDERTRIAKTAASIREQFTALYNKRRTDIFSRDDRPLIQLDDNTIYEVAVELSRFQMLWVDVDVVAKAFQIFRTKALKSGEGQFLTPLRVVRSAIMALDIRPTDKMIDPAGGTGGFVMEATRQVKARLTKAHPKRPDHVNQLLTKWANEKVWSIDIDPIGIKLTRAMMLAIGDGSTHTLLGDSIRSHRWAQHYPHLGPALSDNQYTVVVTNPPFGEQLKVRASDARLSEFTISKFANFGRKDEHIDLEIGLVFLERAFRLLQVGGRLGIVLPETYFFSYKYRWLELWLHDRLKLRGMLNIPMEAFQEFCRAKTNFYIFEKVGTGYEDYKDADKHFKEVEL